jgi:hypothetical protein
MSSSDRRQAALAAAALLLLHLALSVPLQGPMLFGDETAYLGMARFLAGRAPDLQLASPAMKHGAFLSTAYSLALVPAGLFASPLATYRAALLFNAVCAVALFLVLAAFSRRVLGLPPPRALLAALVASLYPAAFLFPKLAWSESLVFLLVAALPGLFLQLAERRTAGAAALFGAAVGTACWVHQRTLPVFALALLALVLLVRRRALTPGAAVTGATAALLPFLAGRLTNAWVWERLSSRGTPLSEMGLLASLLRPEGLWQSFLSTIGQLWYLTAATVGTALLGAWMLGRLATGDSGRSPRGQAAGFALLSGVSLFALSVAFVIVPDRVDKLFYGRYWEPALGLFLAAGMARLLERPPGRAAFAVVSLTPLALGAALVTLRGGSAFQGLFNELNVLGVAPWTLVLGRVRVLWIAALATALGLLVLALARWRPAAGPLALAVLFASGSLFTYARLLLPANRGAQTTLRIPVRLAEMPSGVPVAYDEGHLTERTFYAYPFWISGRRLLWFDSRSAPAAAPLVVSAQPWPEAPAGARVIYPENVTRQALWVLPGEVQDHLAAAGALFPADLAAPIPDEACRPRLSLGAAGPWKIGAGEAVSVPLRLAHAGRGAPWVAASALPSPGGAMRLGLHWFLDGQVTAERRAELPWSMVPGEEVEIDLPLEARRPDGAPLSPGTYDVRISLVQELVRWCPEDGEGSARLRVEVVGG